jgi:hypothetical protein
VFPATFEKMLLSFPAKKSVTVAPNKKKMQKTSPISNAAVIRKDKVNAGLLECSLKNIGNLLDTFTLQKTPR